jgi:adenosylcobinamide kinase/adenosylcobinamide-phosphate guanylyltransferase
MNKKEIILVLGGARSGKSDTAMKLARRYGSRVIFVATAGAGDEEMKHRIAAHKKSRPPQWKTIEATLDIGENLASVPGEADVVIIDCLTMLVTNIMMKQGDDASETLHDETVTREIDAILDACSKLNCSCIVVSNETGMGIVPEYKLARVFRDVLGRVNKYVASKADTVLLMIAGLAVDLKKLSVDTDLID